MHLFCTKIGKLSQIRQKSYAEQKVYQLRQKSFGKCPNSNSKIYCSAKVPIPPERCFGPGNHQSDESDLPPFAYTVKNRRAYTTTKKTDRARVLLVHGFSIYAEFRSYIAAGIFPAFADDARGLENSKKIKPIKIDIFHV